jgi:hypothetical protein
VGVQPRSDKFVTSGLRLSVVRMGPGNPEVVRPRGSQRGSHSRAAWHLGGLVLGAVVTVRTLQGMARVRSGQAPVVLFVSFDRRCLPVLTALRRPMSA